MARLTDSRVAAIKPPAKGQEEYPDDLVTGLRLRVGAGGRKAWIVRARAGRKQVNKTLGAYPLLSLAAARDAGRAFLIQLASDEQPRTDRTFGELAQAWIEKVAKPRNRSWRLQERRLEIHVLPRWRTRKLSTIRRADVRDLIDTIEGEVAPNRVLTLVRTIFRYAMAQDWIDASPVEGIGKPNSEVPRDRHLDMTEARRVFEGADLLGYPFGPFVKLLLLTGQRRTEVAAMRWADVDLEGATWTLPAEAAKNGKAHLVPLSPPALAILKAIPILGPFVFTETGKTPISGFSKAKSRLDAFLTARGGALAPWVLHDVRRTVATHMVRLGTPELVVGRVLNHSAQGVTAKVYALHSYAPEKRAALEGWAAELQARSAGPKLVAIR
jgi:integrase